MGEVLRVLQVVSIMNRGGIENMLMNLYRTIDRNSVQFDFVVHRSEEGNFDSEILEMGGLIYHAPHYKVTNHIEYVNWWKAFFKEHSEYRIIHSHTYAIASIHLSIAKKNGLKTIVHSHSSSTGKGMKALMKGVLQRHIADIPDYLFSCSDKAGEWLYGRVSLGKPNYFLLKNAIDTNKFTYNEKTRDKVRSELGLAQEVTLGHVGNFTDPKNYPFILCIFRDLLKRGVNSKLVLVGTGPLVDTIKNQASESEIIDKIIFTGTRNDVFNVLQAMDFFIFPSIFEGLPVTVIEAQASGLKCFISDNITKEVCVTELVKQLPISASDVWVDAIVNSIGYKRQAMEKEIAASGYDIQSTAKWLSTFYWGIYNENK
jgi:glycosyltransferase involved in cell wall biosynthesis